MPIPVSKEEALRPTLKEKSAPGSASGACFFLLKVFLVVSGLVSAAPSCRASAIYFPSGYIPFDSIYYVSGPDSAGYSAVEGISLSSGILHHYVNSLPSVTDFEAYANQPIELAPGQYFSNVLVPTNSDREGDFQDFAGPLLNPYADGYPFTQNLIPLIYFGTPYVFLIGPETSPAPEPTCLLLSALGLGAFVLSRIRFSLRLSHFSSASPRKVFNLA